MTLPGQAAAPYAATQPGLFLYVDPATAILARMFYRISSDCVNPGP